MASTSSLTERESANTSQETAPFPSSPSLCSSCFDWVSSFIPWRLGQSDPRGSTSTADLVPDNEVICAFDGTAPSDEAIGAFHGIAPSASTSASKRTQETSYDVFINHRGPDVKHTLASVLYGILTGMQLSVFLDSQELKYGDLLPRTIEAVMATALLHVAIFSKSYAESPWCLAELSFMLKSGAKIIPIFYYVDPSDLRRVDQGNGMYVQAFKKHEWKGRYSKEQLQEWKRALHVVSFYNGQIIKTNKDEKMLLKNIVSCVLKETNKNVPLVVAKHPVGLKEIVEEFKASTRQSVHGNDDVHIVGIWGMGGSGKTTLAKELYNEYSSSMEKSSFVFNIRDAASENLLHEKQKNLLRDLSIKDPAFDNIEEGMRTLSGGLRSNKVLIVLDDVDNVEQLDALLPTKDCFKRDSLIIVTTRAFGVLKSWGISSTYKMKQMGPLYAKQLFCWHAFLKSCPPDGFEELVEKFVNVCDGLPLSLKVFGAQLHGESRKEYWESLLLKISRILPKDIMTKLRISYDALDNEEKEMFLDTACFFIGEESSLAIEVWNGMGWSGLQSWEMLLDKCLVELDDYNLIRMHDHLRDLGRDIAKKQSPYRIWFPQQIIDVQKREEKRIVIQGIMGTSSQIIWGLYKRSPVPLMVTPDKNNEVDEFRVWCSEPLTPSLVGLKYLVTRGDYFNLVMGEVSRDLVWLRWFQIGQRNLPSGLSLKNLSVLELYEETFGEHQLEELWGETDGEAPVQLRQLIISNCHQFQGFPKSIRHLDHLKKIVIIDGLNVTSLPDEFCLLRSLEHLVLHQSYMLSSLPSNFGNLGNLRHLDLSDCRELRRLPVSFKNLMLLEYLNLNGCVKLTFTSEEDLNFLENITKLEYLNLRSIRQLKELPRHVTNQASLRELHLSGNNIRDLPNKIGQLSRLRVMWIEHLSFLTSLPASLGDLSSLTYLQISGCPELEFLPDSLRNLSSLTTLSIGDSPKLKCPLDFLGDLSSLTYLRISYCPELECLPDSLRNLSSLTTLLIWNSPKLKCPLDFLGDLSSLTTLSIESLGVKSLPKTISQLNNLQSLSISSCPISELDFGLSNLSNPSNLIIEGIQVSRISFSEDCCSQLESLYVYENHHLEEIKALPRTLQSIYLENSEMLKNIPSFARLTSLRKFDLTGCYGIEKIEGLENCTRLEELTVHTCWEVPGIESLEHMQNLKQLDLRANKGSVIEHCIQRIQKWPDEEIKICARAVPDAASHLDSLKILSPNLIIVDSISNQNIESRPTLELRSISEGDACVFCFVINCVSSSKMRIGCPSGWGWERLLKVEKGRWAWVAVFTQRSRHLTYTRHYLIIPDTIGVDCGEVEKGLVVRGEEQTLIEAVPSLLRLLLES